MAIKLRSKEIPVNSTTAEKSQKVYEEFVAEVKELNRRISELIDQFVERAKKNYENKSFLFGSLKKITYVRVALSVDGDNYLCHFPVVLVVPEDSNINHGTIRDNERLLNRHSSQIIRTARSFFSRHLYLITGEGLIFHIDPIQRMSISMISETTKDGKRFEIIEDITTTDQAFERDNHISLTKKIETKLGTLEFGDRTHLVIPTRTESISPNLERTNYAKRTIVILEEVISGLQSSLDQAGDQ